MKPIAIALAALVALPFAGRPSPQGDTIEELEALLTDFHAAAAEADADRYLGYLAPDAVLFGTDASERWTVEDYSARVRPAMQQGIKIVSVPREQNVYLAEGGDVAWFDERLDKPKYGELRATGVLRRGEEGWRIVQINVSLPVPNEVLQDIVKLIRAAQR